MNYSTRAVAILWTLSASTGACSGADAEESPDETQTTGAGPSTSGSTQVGVGDSDGAQTDTSEADGEATVGDPEGGTAGGTSSTGGSNGEDDCGPWTYSGVADMGETGGNIVLRLAYDQVSMIGKNHRQRIFYDGSPDDAYTVTTSGLPDGLEVFHDVEDKRIYIQGTPTDETLTMSPYVTVVTLANSTDERVIRYNWVVRDGVIPETDDTFRPCGGNPDEGGTLWSWAWAGAQQQHVTIRDTAQGPKIEWMEDLSGNDHFYFNDTGAGHATEVGYTWRDYYTPYPTVGLNWPSAGGNYNGQALHQSGSLGADGEFYLAAAIMNTRTSGNGNREIFGSRDSGNVVKYTQGPDGTPGTETGVINFQINGQGETLMPKGSYSAGPLLVEFWRDADDRVTVFVNGVDLTQDGVPPVPGLFDMTGLGVKNASSFDDAGFEFIVCKGLPDAQTRAETREHLRKKWKMF